MNPSFIQGAKVIVGMTWLFATACFFPPLQTSDVAAFGQTLFWVLAVVHVFEAIAFLGVLRKSPAAAVGRALADLPLRHRPHLGPAPRAGRSGSRRALRPAGVIARAFRLRRALAGALDRGRGGGSQRSFLECLPVRFGIPVAPDPGPVPSRPAAGAKGSGNRAPPRSGRCGPHASAPPARRRRSPARRIAATPAGPHDPGAVAQSRRASS